MGNRFSAEGLMPLSDADVAEVLALAERMEPNMSIGRAPGGVRYSIHTSRAESALDFLEHVAQHYAKEAWFHYWDDEWGRGVSYFGPPDLAHELEATHLRDEVETLRRSLAEKEEMLRKLVPSE